MAELEPAKVDLGAVQKYVLLQIGDDEVVCRGKASAAYHDDVRQGFEEEERGLLEGKGVKVLGGGRIKADQDGKNFEVYGYSVAYGRADHTIACGLLEAGYPGCKTVWTNDGY